MSERVRLLICPNCAKRVVPEGATKCPECAFDGTPTSGVTTQVASDQQVNAEIERKRLEDTIAKGVERGVLRAIGIYLLITVLIAFIVVVIHMS